MKHPPYLRAHPDGIVIAIKLQPRASRNEIVGPASAELKVAVTAPPVDGAANGALVELLAETLNCGRGSIAVVRGQTSRHKAVLVTGVTLEQAAARLPR